MGLVFWDGGLWPAWGVGLLPGDGVEPWGAGHAFEFVFASIVEVDA